MRREKDSGESLFVLALLFENYIRAKTRALLVRGQDVITQMCFVLFRLFLVRV